MSKQRFFFILVNKAGNSYYPLTEKALGTGQKVNTPAQFDFHDEAEKALSTWLDKNSQSGIQQAFICEAHTQYTLHLQRQPLNGVPTFGASDYQEHN